MKKIKMNFLKEGKAVFLAYDHGLEHGPTEFDDKDVDPQYIIDIAEKGEYSALIFQKGIAEKFNDQIKKSKIPLIIKLNGKTSLYSGEPVSRQICSVEEARKLGAVAVGYTIYIGSEYESIMMEEFDKIEEEAHKYGLPVIAWIYPRGKSVEDKPAGELMAYAGRTALEIGADMAKIRYNGNLKDLIWTVKAAGPVKVFIAGGNKEGESDFINEVKDIMKAGCAGIAVGRNVWQAEKPLEVTKKIKKIVWKG
jgi:fructose-bisphosphate aldolase, class I